MTGKPNEWATETDACPLTGCRPRHRPTPYTPTANNILMPGLILPAGTTDATAEHERAIGGYIKWTRSQSGEVILWTVR